jgi:hypothetical protein
MFKLSKLAGLLAAMLLATMWAMPAQAQATRTWISGVGDDANPCSITAPCKTFAGAISKTATGGEIDCHDPGGFGTVTIVKSITLDCGGGNGGQVGSILVSGTNGITINCSDTNQVVKIRNMTINGLGQTVSSSLDGIRFVNGKQLIVEHVAIFGFGGASSSGMQGGVSFEPGFQVAGDAAKLSMVDVEAQYNNGDGVLVHPANGGTASVSLVRVSAIGNVGSGIRLDNTGNTSGTGITASLFDVNASNNGTGLSALSPTGTVAVNALITHSVISQNGAFGLLSSGANATIVVGNTAVSGNLTGLAAGGGAQVKTFADNYFYNGATGTSNGTPTATVTKL